MEIRLNIVLDISDRMGARVARHRRASRRIPGHRRPPVTAKEAPQSVQNQRRWMSPPKCLSTARRHRRSPRRARRGGGAAARQMLGRESARTHMDARFRALIGDDWETRVDSDADAKKRQRQITAAFKSIAAQLGAVKYAPAAV